MKNEKLSSGWSIVWQQWGQTKSQVYTDERALMQMVRWCNVNGLTFEVLPFGGAHIPRNLSAELAR